MQKWDKELLWNYKPSLETFSKGMLVTEKIGKLNVRMKDVFSEHTMPSRIFAYIESKYSHCIEGIYTTLFDVVNTGAETNQQKIIKPIVEALFKDKAILSVKEIKAIEDVLNFGTSKSGRFEEPFGIYKQGAESKTKIYTPPMDPEEVEKLLLEVIEKAASDKNIIQMLHTHILFEKIHPFVDGNGRLGRLILQKSVNGLMNFTSVTPLSWAFFKCLSAYYEAFDIESIKDLDQGIQNLLDIFLTMYEQTKKFLNELKIFKNDNLKKVMNTSRVVSEKIAEDILLTLQTKSSYLQRVHKINPRTVDIIFEKLNNEQDLPFNEKVVNRQKLFWNIELETMIDKYFN